MGYEPKARRETREKANRVRKEVAELQEQIDDKKRFLDNLVRACAQVGHDWSEVEYTPEHREGYTIPESGGGSDRQPAHYVPPKTVPKWTRQCMQCGHTEITTRTREKKETIPEF